MQLVLPLCPLPLRPLRLIALLRGPHRQPACGFGFHRRKREEFLELLALALRTNGHRLEDECLEAVPALFALEIEDRHSLLQRDWFSRTRSGEYSPPPTSRAARSSTGSA